MANVLLISSKTLREHTNISDNITDNFLLPAIREVQVVHLQQVLGSSLYEKLLDLVSEGTISQEENKAYKTLIDKSKEFLMYSVMAQIIPITAFKIDNAGTYQSATNEERNVLNLADTMQVADMYTHKADYYKMRLQSFLMEHREDYPELSDCDYYNIHNNLYSAASSGLWLGGKRGKGRTKTPTFGYDYDL